MADIPHVKLGSSPLQVSQICLGSMTWGVQNSQADADQQIDFALDAGINFIDTAEMYAIPPKPDTYGTTEAIIGNWLSRNPGKRGQIVLASKIAGSGLSWVREGSKITSASICQAVDDSLARLQTDVIDLYQLHWPNRRPMPHFGKHWPGETSYSKHLLQSQQVEAEMIDCLEGLQQCIDAGKIRYAGLSNETPWGLATYLRLAKEHNLPRIASVQNEFNLIQFKDWPYLIESCILEEVAYLPWSPLAGGALSGKYLDGRRPTGSRWTMTQRNGLFRDTPQSREAIAAYSDLAKAHSITMSQLALAWCYQVEGVTSTIIGATTIEQLRENIAAFDHRENAELMESVGKLIKRYAVTF